MFQCFLTQEAESVCGVAEIEPTHAFFLVFVELITLRQKFLHLSCGGFCRVYQLHRIPYSGTDAPFQQRIMGTAQYQRVNALCQQFLQITLGCQAETSLSVQPSSARGTKRGHALEKT